MGSSPWTVWHERLDLLTREEIDARFRIFRELITWMKHSHEVRRSPFWTTSRRWLGWRLAFHIYLPVLLRRGQVLRMAMP